MNATAITVRLCVLALTPAPEALADRGLPEGVIQWVLS